MKKKRADQMNRLLAISGEMERENETPGRPTPTVRRSKPPAIAPAPVSAEKRPVGRPPGKRTNPEYQSVTTFLHKQTYLDTQRALIGAEQDFGDLVDELLADWLKRRL